MKRENLEKTAVSVVSLTAGAMASRIVADKLTMVKNNKLKRGGLILAGIICASMLDRKSTGKAIVQDASIGMAVTQAGYLAKELISPKEEGILTTALGSPMDEPIYMPDVDFLAGYEDYDFEEDTIDVETMYVDDFAS